LIKGLIFDFDGLILDTEVPEYETWQHIYHSHGGKLSFEKWTSIVGTSSEGFDVISDLEEQIGKKVNREELRSLHSSTTLSIIDAKEPQPGVVEYLANGRASGMRVGLASSSKMKWIKRHLSRLQLLDYFECFCAAEDVEKVKPAPDLYLLAMEKLSLEPSQSIAFEDSPNGIQAAKDAGMICVAVPNAITSHLNLSKADLIIDSLEKFKLEELIIAVEKIVKSDLCQFA
jgi:HAD superfamily hydrolase (TIGR01509 family)